MNRKESEKRKNKGYRDLQLDRPLFDEVKKGNLELVLTKISEIYYAGLMSNKKFWQFINVISKIWKNN